MRRGILATRDELRSLRSRIAKSPFDRFYDALQKRCALVLESPPVTETRWRTMWQQGRWSSALGAARTTQGRILDLAIAHHIDPNGAYRSRAIEELTSLAGWSTWVDPCHSPLGVDLCTAEAAVAAAVGLDWLGEDMTDADRQRVVEALQRHVLEPYQAAIEQKVWWYTCYHNWNAVVNGGCGLAALALGDENRLAQKLYTRARTGLRAFFAALGKEGGWDEGTGYWGYAMRYALLLGEAASRLADDQKIFHSRGMDATGLFGVYFTPNGHAASFGDAPHVPAYGTLYNLVRHYRQPQLAWWLDTYTLQHDVTTTGWSQAGLALLLRPDDIETDGAVDLDPVRIFEQIGWAAMADAWPRPQFYVAAKTGDLAANHSHRDMNSIQLQVDGEMILTDPGNPAYSPEYFSESRSEFYEVQAQAHNTMVFAEQDHQIDAQGVIAESACGANYRWVVCDAKEACGENVRFFRHLVMVVDPADGVGQMLVVLDEIIAGAPERLSLFWHTQGRVELDARTHAGSITAHRAKVNFALAGTTGITVERHDHSGNGNRVDHVLEISTGLIGPGMLASVFARQDVSRGVEINQDDPEKITVQAANVRVDFVPGRGYLQLKDVTFG